MIKRLRLFIRKAREADMGLRAYFQTLTNPQKQALRTDMKALSVRRPGLVPLIKHLFPNLTLPRTSVYAGSYTHPNGRITDNVCILRDSEWWFYGTDEDGNGVGGDKPCPVNPATAPLYPSSARSPGWGKRSRAMLTEDDDVGFRQFLRGLLQEERDDE